MDFRGFLNLAKGALKLPTPAADPGSPTNGQVWYRANVLWAHLNGVTRQVLSAADKGVANGVVPLNASGLIDPSYFSSTNSLVGGLSDWVGSPSSIPAGWLLCDGSEYAQASYPALYAVIGKRGGSTTDSTKFRVPNLIGRTTIGGWAVLPSAGTPCAIRVIRIVTGGTGAVDGTYSVTLTGGTSTVTATVSVAVVGGIVTRIRVTNPGNYTSAASLTVPTGAFGGAGFTFDIEWRPVTATQTVPRIRVTAQGTGYTSVPDVTITGTNTATAVAVVSGGKVVDVVITDLGGAGTYTGVTFAGGGGSGAAASIDQPVNEWTVGDYGGEQQHQITTEEMARLAVNNIFRDAIAGDGTFTVTTGGGALHTASVSWLGAGHGDVPHNTMPPVFAVLKLIRALP